MADRSFGQFQVTPEFDGGPVVGFVAESEKRPALEAIVAGLESARIPS